MSKTIVLASNNAGKVREFNALLAGLDLEVVPQSQFGVAEIEETGLTFVENAILKARNAAQHAQRPAIADDSGLEVDALDGAPGIYSARYAGPGATFTQNDATHLQVNYHSGSSLEIVTFVNGAVIDPSDGRPIAITARVRAERLPARSTAPLTVTE